MLKYNHYLQELGIKPTDFPFGDYDEINCDPRYQEDEEGFRDAEFWSLDYTLACYIYSHLCYFRDYCLVAHPGYMTGEQWANYLNKMIKAFKLYIEPDEIDYTKSEEKRRQMSKNKEKQIKYGMRLFIKYFGHLWY